MTTALQRAAARRNIKKAIAANRRGGKKHKKSHRSGRSSAGASHSYGIGSAYLDGKVAAQVVSPVVDLATHLQGQTAAGAAADLKAHVMSSAYAQGAISAIGQRWVDKKIGQAAALSRGSITAWASELIPIARTISAGDRSARGIFSQFNLQTTGYNPLANGFNFAEAAPYVGTKVGFGIARKIASRTRLLTPVKKGLGKLGVSF